jgi:hypothetical protein
MCYVQNGEMPPCLILYHPETGTSIPGFLNAQKQPVLRPLRAPLKVSLERLSEPKKIRVRPPRLLYREIRRKKLLWIKRHTAGAYVLWPKSVWFTLRCPVI